jgi:hypothetical protein
VGLVGQGGGRLDERANGKAARKNAGGVSLEKCVRRRKTYSSEADSMMRRELLSTKEGSGEDERSSLTESRVRLGLGGLSRFFPL